VLKSRRPHPAHAADSSSQRGADAEHEAEHEAGTAASGKGDSGKPGDKGRPIVVVMEAA
jgi:hypothetical protein